MFALVIGFRIGIALLRYDIADQLQLFRSQVIWSHVTAACLSVAAA